MQVAAANPQYLRREDVPEEILQKEREILAAQARNEGKPEHVIEKIVAGRIEKYFQENCLLEQQFIKDTDITVGELLKEKIVKTGENISIRRFARYEMGEGLEKKDCSLAEEVSRMVKTE